jgi:hypothetical protein
MIRSQYDLLGSWLWPLSSLAFHAKKISDGIATATARDKTKEGIAVIAGKGPIRVGTLELNNPMAAGMSNAIPAAKVAAANFVIRSSFMIIGTFICQIRTVECREHSYSPVRC